jgi:hypothetical protein
MQLSEDRLRLSGRFNWQGTHCTSKSRKHATQPYMSHVIILAFRCRLFSAWEPRVTPGSRRCRSYPYNACHQMSQARLFNRCWCWRRWHIGRRAELLNSLQGRTPSIQLARHPLYQQVKEARHTTLQTRLPMQTVRHRGRTPSIQLARHPLYQLNTDLPQRAGLWQSR